MLFSKTLAARAALVAVAAIVLALAPATAAEAVDEVRVGTDGSTWSSGLSAPLFGTVLGLVPEESRSEVLWVQNASPHAVTLRITLDTSAWTDQAFADAMTITAAAPGASGTTASATAAAGTCTVLLSGATLDPGESIPVTMTIALGSLTGRTGQDASVTMTLGVTIYETAGTAGPGACDEPTVVVPATPPTPAGGGATAPVDVDQPATATPSPRPTGEDEEATPPIFTLASLVGLDGSPLLWALIAALGGGAIFYLVEYSPWRRGRRRDENAEPNDAERLIP